MTPKEKTKKLLRTQKVPDDVKTGLDKDEVFVVMQQVPSNNMLLCIQALRKYGNLVDAILNLMDDELPELVSNGDELMEEVD